MGLADALISKLAKMIVDNLDAAVSSRLASADSRLNVLDAPVSSRMASADSRIDKLDTPVSSRAATADPRFAYLDGSIAGRMATADSRIPGFGGPRMPVQTGYVHKALTGLTQNGYFCFKSQTIATDRNFGLRIVRTASATNPCVTIVDVTGAGHLLGVLYANVSGGANSSSIQVIVDGVTVINLADTQVGTGQCFLWLGIVDAYWTGSAVALVATPNLSAPMFYSSSLQVKIKSNYAGAYASAVYV